MADRGRISMISAVVLAAGQSKRMGRPKINLSWGETTVLGAVLSALQEGGIDHIVVITGLISIVGLDPWIESKIQFVPNPLAETSEMLVSLQFGLRALSDDVDAALIVLGDQPQIQSQTVAGLLSVYQQNRAPIIVPSYRMRRGHPWLIQRSLWTEILSLPSSVTMRQFLENHKERIYYHNVDTGSILLDLDTPEDYQRYKPEV
jgi:molybdenum cofactor cytidylyltransferase